MPVEPVVRGSRIIYMSVPWPDECKLQARPREEMTADEIRAELKLLLTDREEDLHKACCVNPSCPAKR
jgi:hypothetical protein